MAQILYYGAEISVKVERRFRISKCGRCVHFASANISFCSQKTVAIDAQTRFRIQIVFPCSQTPPVSHPRPHGNRGDQMTVVEKGIQRRASGRISLSGKFRVEKTCHCDRGHGCIRFCPGSGLLAQSFPFEGSRAPLGPFWVFTNHRSRVTNRRF